MSSTTNDPATGFPDLETLGKDADLTMLDATNFETPPARLTDFHTPVRGFFVRSNFPFPDYTRESWRLTISGLVAHDLTITYDDLQTLPCRTLTSWMECYGNSRALFTPGANGNQWTGGAVGNATWTGVSLAAVLERAGVQPGAVEVVCQGGDDARFQRALPIEKALDPDTMLVWEMNGAPLTRVHGYPVRLIVPGWGGIASVKWITHLTLVDTPFEGQYQTVSYVLFDAEGQNLGKVREQPTKSLITSLQPQATVQAGQQTISGLAWSGYAGITQVGFSTDGGETWHDATIMQNAGSRSWVTWSYAWDAAPGAYVLTSRATDAAGNVQPKTPRWNKNGYQYNGWHLFPVQVQ